MTITLSGGCSIEDPEARVREYVRVEVYEGFDDQHAVTNEIGWSDVRTANRLYARLGRKPAAALIASSSVRRALGLVEDIDLDAFAEQEWQRTQELVRGVLARAMEHRGIALAVATKILHLKRPRLVPILDSFVVQFLQGIEIGAIGNKARLVEVGIEAMETIRSDLCAQREEFAKLQDALDDLPIPLTRVRLYDILCWSTEKWDVRGDLNAPFGTARVSGQKEAEPGHGATAGTPPGRHARRAIPSANGREIRTLEDFRQIIDSGEGFVVITDSANPNRVHEAGCSRLREGWFVTKVVENHGRNGRYHWVPTKKIAFEMWDARECRFCIQGTSE